MNFKYILFIGFVLFNGINSMNPLKEEIKNAAIQEKKTPTDEDYKNTLKRLKATEYWATETKGFQGGQYFYIPSEAKIILAAAKTDSFLKIEEDSIETDSKLKDSLELFFSYEQPANLYSERCAYATSRQDNAECRKLYQKMEKARDQIKLSYYFLKTSNENNKMDINKLTNEPF